MRRHDVSLWRAVARALAASLLLPIFGACSAKVDPSNAEPQALGARATGPVRPTEGGAVRGVETATTREFRGIPYAAAPVGDLRWRPPQPHERWNKLLDATKFGANCPQVASSFGQASVDEDCLFLNVYTPKKAHPMSNLPVMVWFHGGVFLFGQGNAYDPTKLVDRGDVIVVTINYRLGELGFLAHPALTAESPDHASGNYGIMDQQAALGWVQRNIRFFGGDPSRVTIFGESAGGVSVHVHVASPTAAGMFSRAIVQSGAYVLAQPTLAAAEAAGTAFATKVGCTDQTAACLRSLAVTDILPNQRGPFEIVPNIDGKVITQSVASAMTTGDFAHVPILEGSNHDEWRLFVAISYDLASGPLSAADYPAAIQAIGVPAAAVPLFEAEYPLANYASPDLALSALGTDGIFACNARYLERLESEHTPTYAYEFNDASAPPLLPPVSFPYAAAHASELPYLFGLFGFPALDVPLSDTMVDYWTTFARTGAPTVSSSSAPWDQYDSAIDAVQSLEPPTPVSETGFAADHKCAFWGLP